MKSLIHLAVLLLLVLGSPYWVGSGGDEVGDTSQH